MQLQLIFTIVGLKPYAVCYEEENVCLNYLRILGNQKAQWITKNHMVDYQNMSIIRIRPVRTVRAGFCLKEKYEIATYKVDNLLNKKIEIISTCRHRNKYKLANYGTID